MSQSQELLPVISKRNIRCFCAAVVIVAITTALLNLPGQAVLEPDILGIGQYGPHFELQEHYEHGWPFVFLWRLSDPVAQGQPMLTCWMVHRDIFRFRVLPLVVNLMLGVGIASVATVFWCGRARCRKRPFRFTLLEIGALVVILGAVFGYYVARRSQYLRDLRLVESLEASKERISASDSWQLGGPTWIRRIIGDIPFRALDRVIAVSIAGDQLRLVSSLDELKVIRIIGGTSNDCLNALSELPRLEAIDMNMSFIIDNNAESETVDKYGNVVPPSLSIPFVPSLRGVNLQGTAFRGEGLSNVPKIEVLDISDTDVTAASIPELSSLENLKMLDVSGTDLSDSDVTMLRRQLPNCDVHKRF